MHDSLALRWHVQRQKITSAQCAYFIVLIRQDGPGHAIMQSIRMLHASSATVVCVKA